MRVGRLPRALLLTLALLAAGACNDRVPVPVWFGDGPAPWELDAAPPVPDAHVAAAGFIYVVDDSFNLLTFEPSRRRFARIGTLQCPGTAGTPFSMGVERNARAWVLYSDGQLFWVDTGTAACTRAGIDPRRQGLQRYGMGFATDGPGAQTEQLYVIGSSSYPGAGTLAAIDPVSLGLTRLGNVPIGAGAMSPELTGTGAGELYAFFPGQPSRRGRVVQLRKSDGKVLRTWNLPREGPHGVTAWAFAHWGGMFYMFVTTSRSIVRRLDPRTGKVTAVVSQHPYDIVGAGVSSRAPLVHPDGGPGDGALDR